MNKNKNGQDICAKYSDTSVALDRLIPIKNRQNYLDKSEKHVLMSRLIRH